MSKDDKEKRINMLPNHREINAYELIEVINEGHEGGIPSYPDNEIDIKRKEKELEEKLKDATIIKAGKIDIRKLENDLKEFIQIINDSTVGEAVIKMRNDKHHTYVHYGEKFSDYLCFWKNGEFSILDNDIHVNDGCRTRYWALKLVKSHFSK